MSSARSAIRGGAAGASAEMPELPARWRRAELTEPPRAPLDSDGTHFEAFAPLGDVPSDGPEGAEDTPPDRLLITCVNKTGLESNTTTLMSLPELDPPRQFYVHVPKSYDPGIGMPVVIDLHGLGGSADVHPGSQAAISGWRQKGDVAKFITVHPLGVDASWNGGKPCCPPANLNDIDDEGFMRAIVEKLSDEGCIDTSRIYATGTGNGGALAHLLACRAADVFAGVAPISMGNAFRPCVPSRPISVVMFRGTRDATVSYYGGTFPSAAQDFELWKTLNGCRGEPQPTQHEGRRCTSYLQCLEGVRVTLCSPEAGNVLYHDAQQQGIAVPDVAWDVFTADR